jgi:hypothetical protein
MVARLSKLPSPLAGEGRVGGRRRYFFIAATFVISALK